MRKLNEINEVAYVRFASYYKSFTDIASFRKSLESVNIVGEESGSSKDSTDIHLLVSAPAKGMTTKWSRERIMEALVSEAGISKEQAEEIAISVEKKVIASGIGTITVNLVRELVDNEMFVRG
jgi:transcriptional regulator NrdR family protein